MSDAKHAETPQAPAWRGWALFLAALVVTFLLGLLAASIFERRQEARERDRPPLVPIAEFEPDSSKWGVNYPRQYDAYRRMEETGSETRFGGTKLRDYLEKDPVNVLLFAGYGFSEDYQQARGHVYAVTDVTQTLRISPKTPATCWTCKSPDVPRLMAQMGPEKFYAGSFAELKGEVTHPIGCADCHEPSTMRLRITRPALVEAFQRQGKDIQKVSHQEMRTLVCAQCHVEYYFKGDGKYLTFPWDKGTRLEEIEQYYDEVKFTDWTHAASKTKMLKMQHPDYEIYLTGIHAYRNVSCTDCHMPYRTEGGVKYTDHHLQSPLLNIANSCSICHRWGEDEIRQRVYMIQDKAQEGRQRVERALAQAHLDIAAAIEAGAKEEELESARQLLRRAQMRWDFIAANNGMGFHSPQESMRILEAAVDLAGQCRVETARTLARHGMTDPVAYPEYDTKAKAQALVKQFIGAQPPALAKPK